jgi:monoamine oxidase
MKTKTKMKRPENSKTRKKREEYDIIILGGGIAGIYTLYNIVKNPLFINKKILLLEKTERFGGRVYSINPYKTHPEDIIEGGAGRFSQKHILLNKLIQELNLEDKIQKIGNGETEYYPINRENNNNNNNNNTLITKVINASKKESIEYLRTISFCEYASKILSKDEVQYIQDSFGYYSELVIMNTYDAIQLLGNLNTENHFNILIGGLSQINERMIQFVVENKNKNLSIQKNQNVIKISQSNPNNNSVYQIKTQNKKYITRMIICALPKQILERISFFKPIYPLLSKIKCAPLCRIYSRFEGNSWFKNLPKITTNNNLRMVIPVNKEKGIIMISYTDNKYAEYWNNIYKKEGVDKLNQKIKEEIKESTDIIIPREPMQTNIYYWKCGVGYWGIGANSKEISQKMIQPFSTKHNIFCCGEHYSEKFQQWIEGALETSNKVLEQIIEKEKKTKQKEFR